MRVELIAGGKGNGVTGLSRYGSTLYRALDELPLDVELIRPKVPFDRVLAPLGRYLNLDPITFFSNYPVAIDSQAADIYHLASENLASLLTFKRLQPVVVTVHAFFTYFLRDDPRLAMHNDPFFRTFVNLAARGLFRADALIAVSQYVADLLIDDLGIPPERVHVIYEAVDRDFFRPLPVPVAFCEKYGLERDLFYFLYVGSEQPRKNFTTLLRAFARVRAEHDNVRLLKIGAAEFKSERGRAVELMRTLGIEQDVTFVGHVGSELPMFYNACDVFVFPSLYEGFGFPPLEAMACGTPVVCSNTTSLPEIVGDAALVFCPEDEDQLVHHMRSMLLDGSLRAAFREKGLEQAATLSWDEAARQTIELYEQLLS